MSDAQRAASIVNLQQSWETQRATGFPNLQKRWEAQRADGFHNFKKAVEVQRASGWPSLRKYHAEQAAVGYKDTLKREHAKLLRDIEAANKRKLEEDPTFKPLPLPDFESRPRVDYPKRRGTIPCTEPGCALKFATEQSLAIHIRRMHGGYSAKTPHKCKDPSCNMYWQTERQASVHFARVHNTPKARCPVCDRVLCDQSNLTKHLQQVHGMAPKR